MAWPLSQDYNEAIQNPASSFADAELRQGEAASNALGMPMPRSGNFADVYEVTCPGGSKWAVKCFTREVAGLQQRYARISEFLAQAQLPFMVDFQFLPQGIRVRGQWYPILKMQWVEGLLLNQFVREQLDKPALLDSLSKIWVRLSRWLREPGFAHADLQHGNIILVPASRAGALALRLIDYDGIFVPALAGTKSGELGHPSYQHPERSERGYYGPEVDRLPLLAVACALRAVAVGGKVLWDRYDNGDNLLFREGDLKNPSQSKLFKELWNLHDAPTHDLTGYLTMALGGELEQAPWLDQLVVGEKPQPLDSAQEDWVSSWIGPGAKVKRTVMRPEQRVEAPPEANVELVKMAPAPMVAPAATLIPVPAYAPAAAAVAVAPPVAPLIVPGTALAAPADAFFADIHGEEPAPAAVRARRQSSPRRKRLIIGGGVAAALLVGIIGLVLVLRGGSTPTATLRIKPPAKDFTVEFGDKNFLSIEIERHGYQGPLKISVTGLPSHVEAMTLELGPKDTKGKIKIVALPDARYLEDHTIKIIAEHKKTLATTSARINVNGKNAVVSLEVQEPLAASLGNNLTIPVKVIRRGVVGKLTISADNLPDGVEVEPTEIGDKDTNAQVVLRVDRNFPPKQIRVYADGKGIEGQKLVNLSLQKGVSPKNKSGTEKKKTTAFAKLTVLERQDQAIKYARFGNLTALKQNAALIVQDMLSLLEDKDKNRRLDAINVLRELGPDARDAVVPLIDRLANKKEDTDVRIQVAFALASFGPVAAPLDSFMKIAGVLDDDSEDEFVRLSCITALRVHRTVLGEIKAPATLARIIKDVPKNRLLRYDAAHLLSLVDGPKTAQFVINVHLEVLKDPKIQAEAPKVAVQSDRRLKAVEALRIIGAAYWKDRTEIVEQLTALADDPNVSGQLRQEITALLKDVNGSK